jgi:hypothetical protein
LKRETTKNIKRIPIHREFIRKKPRNYSEALLCIYLYYFFLLLEKMPPPISPMPNTEAISGTGTANGSQDQPEQEHRV